MLMIVDTYKSANSYVSPNIPVNNYPLTIVVPSLLVT